MIELGLARINALLKNTPQTWKAIHVAGTNGKGSICAYLNSILAANHVLRGRFTSPHLLDRWDCITINDNAVSESKFRHFENLVIKRNKDQSLGASEFELLTATAFEIFEDEKIEVGVIEVGLGGRLDATNALKHKSATIISKIGLDHQSFLGNTLEEIALQKAGIMQAGVPCVVDASNPPSVLEAVRANGGTLKGVVVHLADLNSTPLPSKPEYQELEPHQQQNLLCAYDAFRFAFPSNTMSIDGLLTAAIQATWPGRLQSISIEPLCGKAEDVLLDGAHNPQSAEALSSYVEKRLRNHGKPITWVLAASAGKDLAKILKIILRDGDNVAAVKFGPVDGMPWVKPMATSSILEAVDDLAISIPKRHDAKGELIEALQWASEASARGPLVVAGTMSSKRTASPAHLIIVCCHGIWQGGPGKGFDEAEWLIAPFQAGETPTFIEHIKAGLRVLKEDESSVLALSGGPTRKETELSEAESYFNVAVANNYFGICEPQSAVKRILIERFALDSYSNVLMCLGLFFHSFGTFPEKITIVSHGFKKERLVDCHCAAIGFPLSQVDFVGVDPPGMLDGSNQAAIKGNEKAIAEWRADPHGRSEGLAGKRKIRNPWHIPQRMFHTESDRKRSHVQSTLCDDGQEYLIEGVPQPWSFGAETPYQYRLTESGFSSL
ncbi:FolC bifunctional protein [Xylariaceae sp. FL1272]|nr:FolC bifunctional protein [Xylariaceae sp. FL1272]